jgi:hypothetical protein
VQNGFVWGNQIIPILDNQFLPIIGPAAILSYILVEEMRVGNYPGVESDFELVVCNHPLIIFLYLELVRERPGRVFLAGSSRRVLRGSGVNA